MPRALRIPMFGLAICFSIGCGGEKQAGVDDVSSTVQTGDAASDVAGALDGAGGPDIAADSVSADASADAEDATQAVDTAPACACGDGNCDPDCGEAHTTCPADCKAACGDGICQPGEGPLACKADCCGTCGDGQCRGFECGENPTTCAGDCGKPCGDGQCEKGENPGACPADCKHKICGNQVCEPEDGGPAGCPGDCATTCGDCVCDKGETWLDCPADCGACGDGVCSACPGLDETSQTCGKDCGAICEPPDCDDEKPCTEDSCGPNGCLHKPIDATACDDGDACTVEESCLAGVCSGLAVSCDDGIPCTQDSCDSATGCASKPASGSPCDDGDACTSNDACDAATCKGTVTACDDELPCTADSCDSATGCLHPPLDATPCDDGDACTQGDACQGGACDPGPALACDDNNSCTTDTCAKVAGCQHAAAQDGSLCGAASCNGNQFVPAATCVGGTCAAAPKPTSCDDGNACTTDTCNPIVACGHKPFSGPCDDGNTCTSGDTCSGGKCTGTAAIGQQTLGGATTVEAGVSIASLPDGGFAVAGTGPIGATAQIGYWLARLDSAGNVAWQKGYAPGGNTTNDAILNGLVVTTNAGWFLGGCVATKGPYLLQVDANGAKLGEKIGSFYSSQFDPAGDCITGLKVSSGWKGEVVDMAIDKVFKGIHSATGSAILAADQSYWETYNPVVTVQATVRAVVRPAVTGQPTTEASKWVFFGTATTATTGKDGWLLKGHIYKNGSQNATQWETTVGGSGDDHIEAAVALTDGYVAAGWTTSKEFGVPSGTGAWLVRFDPLGSAIWQRVYPGDKKASAVIALADGGFALVGTSTAASGAGIWFARTDKLGNPVAERVFAGTAQGRGLTVRANGGFGLVGSSPGGSGDVAVLRTDGWGKLGCAEAGACAGVGIQVCDDKDSCTADSCDPSTGACLHTAFSDGTACDDGVPCTKGDHCTAGKCVAGPPALWSATTGGAGDDTAVSVVPQAFTGYAGSLGYGVVGQTPVAGSAQQSLALWHFDKGGVVDWQKAYTLAGDTSSVTARAMLALPGGGWLLGGCVATKGPWLVQVDASGAKVADLLVGSGTTYPNGCVVALNLQADGNPVATIDNADAGGKHAPLLQKLKLPLVADGAPAGPTSTQGHTATGAVASTWWNGSTAVPSWILGGVSTTVSNGKDAWVAGLVPDTGTGMKNYVPWEALHGGKGDDSFAAVIQVGYSTYAVGTTNSAELGVAGGTDGWLVALDYQGKALWQRVYGGAGDDRLEAIAPMTDGGFVLVGQTKTAGALGGLWFLRVDPFGNPTASNTFAGAPTDRLRSVGLRADGGLVLAGERTGPGGTGLDAILLAIDPWGRETCEKSGKCFAVDAAICSGGCLARQCNPTYTGTFPCAAVKPFPLTTYDYPNGASCMKTDTPGKCSAGYCN